MNITNNRGSESVAETQTSNIHFRHGDVYFRASEMEVYITDPTIEDVISELQASITAWRGEGEEMAIWNIKCLYKAIDLMRKAHGWPRK